MWQDVFKNREMLAIEHRGDKYVWHYPDDLAVILAVLAALLLLYYVMVRYFIMIDKDYLEKLKEEDYVAWDSLVNDQ